MQSPYLTTTEVAAYFRVDPATVRRWIASGALTGVRIGSVLRVERVEVERFAVPAGSVT